MHVVVVAAVLSAGCFFKPEATSRDGGGGGDDAPADAAPVPTNWGDFSSGMQLDLGPGGTYSDTAPSISDDGRVLVFTSTRAGRTRLFWVTRTGPSISFSQTDVAEVNGIDDAYEPTLSGDGLGLYWMQGGASQRTLAYARRDPGSQVWVPATPPVPSVGPFDFVGGGGRLVGSSSLEGSDPASKIVEYTKNGSAWDQLPLEIDMQMGGETAPCVRSDGRELFFEFVDTTYHSYRSTRATIDLPFDPPMPYKIQGTMEIGDCDLSADGREIYYSTGSGDLRILVARRTPN